MSAPSSRAGETKILALGNAVSSGIGSAPGSLRAIDGGRSNVSAKMGTKDARQSVRVEINGKANDTGIWSKNGFFRMLSADQDEINDCALRGLDLPQGRITEGLRGKKQRRDGDIQRGGVDGRLFRPIDCAYDHDAAQFRDGSVGHDGTFTVTAEGEGLTYQWQYQRPGESTWNDAINNGQSATFNQTNVETRHNGFKFRCKVSNSAGSVISNAAMLTVH